MMRSILIVEDEPLIAFYLRSIAEEVGLNVLGPCLTLDAAMHIISTKPRIDCALLDVSLGGGVNSYPIADALTLINVPLIFVSGNHAINVHDKYPNAQFMEKPFNHQDMCNALRHLYSECPLRTVDIFI